MLRSRRQAGLLTLFLAIFPVASALGQSQGGIVLRGTVTEAGGAPVAAASVSAFVVGSPPVRVQTDAAGRYRFTLAGAPRSVELRVERTGFYRFVAEVALDAAVVTRDVRLNPSAITLVTLDVRSTRPAQRPPQGVTPGGNEEAWQPFFTDPYPLVPGDLAAIAAHRPGVVPLGGEDANGLPRLSIAGRPPSQNRVLVDGASFGASTLPPEALRSTSVVSNSYDPARGQFSGGQIAATTRSGTDLFGGALRARLEPSALQAGSAGADGSGRYSVYEVGGGAGGALLPGRLFWFAAARGAQNSSALNTLATVPDGTLPDLGLSADSVKRFRDLTTALGFSTAWQKAPAQAVARDASGLARIDFNATDAHTLTLRLDARRAETRGIGASAFGITTPNERVTRASSGVLGQVASYLGPFRNELRLYRSVEERRRRGGVEGPGGLVDVLSDLGAGNSGLARLSFGEAAFPFQARSTRTELSDELLVRPTNDDHRVKLGFTLSREQTLEQGAPNASGTFTFRSLEDLEAGRPASFTRTLIGEARGAGADYAAAFAAHLWHASPRLWVIQGVRVERTRYFGADPLAAGLRHALDLPARRIEVRTEVSPRIGFAWEAPGRQWDLRGGIGRFVGTLPLAPLAGSFGETGAGESRLVCLGAAAPAPEWARYAADSSTIPARCADGSGAAAFARDATVFAPGFGPPRSWRASLGGGGPLLRGARGRLDLHVDATLLVGRGEPLAIDRNLAAEPRFVLAKEDSRPVYAPAEGIDAATGAIDPGASRMASAFGIVREAAARGRSTVAQLTVGTTFLSRRFAVLGAYYTWTRATDEVTGFGAPGSFSVPVSRGDPRRQAGGPSDLQRRHNLQLQGVYPIGRWVEVGVIGRVLSGMPFTPLVDADVNGDGIANDAAFVFGGSTADPALAQAMASLRDDVPGAVRRCLERQAGRIAARNSCTGPWRATLDLQVNLPVERGSRPSRFTASIAVNNALAGLGLGSDGYVDPTLLRVRGFDAGRRAFLYDVNGSFGSGRLDPLRHPTTLTLSGRVTLGSDPARQPLLAMTAGIRARGRTATELAQEISSRIPNTPQQVLTLADTLGLGLSDSQRVALEAQAASLGEALAPLVDSLGAALSVVERGRADSLRIAARARGNELVAQLQAGIDRTTEALRAILTTEQWALLPEDVRRPARQLVPPRTLSAGAADNW